MSRSKPALDTVIAFLHEAYGEVGILDLLEINQIVDEVSDFYRVRPQVLRGPSKLATIVKARQMAMYLARTRTPYSLPEIGYCFNRDHTTVVHAMTSMKTKLQAQPQLAQEFQTISNRLESL
jgi:chromosomal replication initiator protein